MTLFTKRCPGCGNMLDINDSSENMLTCPCCGTNLSLEAETRDSEEDKYEGITYEDALKTFALKDYKKAEKMFSYLDNRYFSNWEFKFYKLICSIIIDYQKFKDKKTIDVFLQLGGKNKTESSYPALSSDISVIYGYIENLNPDEQMKAIKKMDDLFVANIKDGRDIVDYSYMMALELEQVFLPHLPECEEEIVRLYKLCLDEEERSNVHLSTKEAEKRAFDAVIKKYPEYRKFKVRKFLYSDIVIITIVIATFAVAFFCIIGLIS